MDCAEALSLDAALVRRAHSPARAAQGVTSRLRADLGPEDFSLIVLFLSPSADAEAVAAGMSAAYPTAEIIGCTTAGEIAARGYVEEHVVAFGLPAAHFDVEIAPIDRLSDFDAHQLAASVLNARARQEQRQPSWRHEFGFLMIDGLSLQEDQVAAALSAAMGPVPFFGGSAGDGLAFGKTHVMHNDRIWQGGAVLARVRTRCPVKIFKIDHLTPTSKKMVVTGADCARRVVTEINAEPAAKEYARLLGKDPEQLSPFTFAAHPLLVKVGGQNHVRSIQRVLPNGDLVFFSAIDEGLVLTLAEPADIVAHLEESLRALIEETPPEAIIACDCILRKLAAEENQAAAAVSQVLARHRVIGFSTYGEQVNGAHVNQTLTGIAIYPPEAA